MQCIVEQEIEMFKFDGKALTPTGVIKIKGGPAGISDQASGGVTTSFKTH